MKRDDAIKDRSDALAALVRKEMKLASVSPKPWMTRTGSTLLSLGGSIGGLAQVMPVPKLLPWLNCVAILLLGLGGALTGQGIRRRLT